MVHSRTSYMQIRYECEHPECINEQEIVKIIAVSPEGFFDCPTVVCAFCERRAQVMKSELVVP